MVILLAGVSVQAQKVRQLILNVDNNQLYMTTKIYRLKHALAADVTPWVEGAVKRNCPQAKVERLNYPGTTKGTMLCVSMSFDMVPYIDDMIRKLDRPCARDSSGSTIAGTDISFFTYRPKYRAAQNMVDIVFATLQGNNTAFYLNKTNNVFYWKDARSDGVNGLKWLRFIDRPVPQVELRLKTYEVYDNDLIDLGLDYIHWKNGPGLEMFGIGADILNFSGNEELLYRGLDLLSKGNYGWGGFLLAPNIDASFVRLLQQRGRARVAASGSITVVNHSLNMLQQSGNEQVAGKTYSIKFKPEFQNISKEENMAVEVDIETRDDDTYEINMQITNPTIFFAGKDSMEDYANENKHKASARLYFSYTLNTSSTVQRDVMGTEAVDYFMTKSSVTVNCSGEKLLGSYTRSYDVYENIGIPFLKDIPIAKYLFSTTTHTRQVKRYFVTVEASSVAPDANLSRWAGKVVTDVESDIREVDVNLLKE